MPVAVHELASGQQVLRGALVRVARRNQWHFRVWVESLSSEATGRQLGF